MSILLSDERKAAKKAYFRHSYREKEAGPGREKKSRGVFKPKEEANTITATTANVCRQHFRFFFVVFVQNLSILCKIHMTGNFLSTRSHSQKKRKTADEKMGTSAETQIMHITRKILCQSVK